MIDQIDASVAGNESRKSIGGSISMPYSFDCSGGERKNIAVETIGVSTHSATMMRSGLLRTTTIEITEVKHQRQRAEYPPLPTVTDIFLRRDFFVKRLLCHDVRLQCRGG